MLMSIPCLSQESTDELRVAGVEPGVEVDDDVLVAEVIFDKAQE